MKIHKGAIKHPHRLASAKHTGYASEPFINVKKNVVSSSRQPPRRSGALHSRDSTVAEIMASFEASWLLNFSAAQNKTAKWLAQRGDLIYDFAGYFSTSEPDSLEGEALRVLNNSELAVQRIGSGPVVQVHIHRAKEWIRVSIACRGRIEKNGELIEEPRLLLIETLYSRGRWQGEGEFMYHLKDDRATVNAIKEKLDMAAKALRVFFLVINFLHLEGPLRYVRAKNPIHKPREPAKPGGGPRVDPAPGPVEQTLYVNKPRYIPTQGAKPEPTGRAQGGHERSGHWVTGRSGKRFWRRASVVNGGWPEGKAPRVRRVRLAAPIEESSPQPKD